MPWLWRKAMRPRPSGLEPAGTPCVPIRAGAQAQMVASRKGGEKWRGEAAQSGSRLAGFVAVPARFPGRGCASLARSREGVIAGDLGEKVMELEGCKISCWPDYPCRVVAGGRSRTQSVCLGWVWGCPLESSVSRASLPLQSLLPPSWRLHFGGCIFTKGQLLQSA